MTYTDTIFGIDIVRCAIADVEAGHIGLGYYGNTVMTVDPEVHGRTYGYSIADGAPITNPDYSVTVPIHAHRNAEAFDTD